MTMTTEPASRPARRGKVATMTQVAEHLDLSRQRVAALVEEGVLQQLPGGKLDIDASRVAYVRWLRTERRSARSEDEQAYHRERTKALEIRNLQRLGELWPREACERVLDEFCGIVNREIVSISARVARKDLALRRKIDQAIFDVRMVISEAAGARADKAKREEETDASD
jgi:terminase small subunit / prophage DNA-packing protein